MTKQGGPEGFEPANDPDPPVRPDTLDAKGRARRAFLTGVGSGVSVGLFAGTVLGSWISKQIADSKEEQKRLQEAQKKDAERLKSDQEYKEKMAAGNEAGFKLQQKFTVESQMNAVERMTIVDDIARQVGDQSVKEGTYGGLTITKKLRETGLSFIDEGIKVVMKLEYPDPAESFSRLRARIEAQVVEGTAKNGIAFKDVYSHLSVWDSRDTGAADNVNASSFAMPGRPDGTSAFLFGAYEALLIQRLGRSPEQARETFSYAHEARTPEQKEAWRNAMNNSATLLGLSTRDINSTYSNFLILIREKVQAELKQ